MAVAGNTYLDHVSSDESGDDTGYDSEAAEFSKTSRTKASEPARKRRKISHSPEEEEGSDDEEARIEPQKTKSDKYSEQEKAQQQPTLPPPSQHNPRSKPKTKHKDRDKKPRPGVIYLSSLPPYLRPSALRNLLSHRGFSPITRLFLAPTSTSKSKSKKSSRQMYSEGWIEFSSHKTAKKCVQALNAQTIGGKKGGYYRDDVWNMRYLRGMGWEELMEGVRGERREEEGRRDEERRQAEREARGFVEGVEEGRRWEGMREKRKRKGKGDDANAVEGQSEERHVWRQLDVKKEKHRPKDELSSEAREVLGKIF
jgi:ESF2/ABP1 family protein